MKDNKSRFHAPTFAFMWIAFTFLAAGIVFGSYYALPLFLSLAAVSFFLFTVSFALFVYFGIKYSREIGSFERNAPIAH